MSLDYLASRKRLGSYDVVVMDDLREQYPEKFAESGQIDWQWFESEIRPHKFVYLRKDKQSLTFTLQSGPIKEVGVNGCQIDTIIEAAKIILEGFQAKFPCRENALAITKLEESLHWLEHRTRSRIERGVEGTNQI